MLKRASWGLTIWMGSLCASSLPGQPLAQGQVPSGYNQSAGYTVDHGFGLHLDASYLYWCFRESMLKIGTITAPASTEGSQFFYSGNGQIVFQSPSYQSGFQVGMGFAMKGMDDWNFQAEYTWYKNHSSQNTELQNGSFLAFSKDIYTADDRLDVGVLLARSVFSKVALDFDSLDTLLERPFYLGKKLIVNVGCGLKALWIHQQLSASGSGLSFLSPASTAPEPIGLAGEFQSTTQQKSWALGPKFQFNTSWLMGYGLKLLGNAAASVLYTRYTTWQTTLSGPISTSSTASVTNSVSDPFNTLRAVTETSLGLGWGSYFCNDHFHIDFSASYDFNVYWNQNMVGLLPNHNDSPGNMYLYGLHLLARFDF
jgi:hypothetical protein